MASQKKFWQWSRGTYRFLIVLCASVLIISIIMFYKYGDELHWDAKEKDTYIETPENDTERIENGIHLRTGLKEGVGLTETINNCTTCHSAKLVTQNRMDRERWTATIRWMQKTQNLWDLGPNEEIIVNYLVTNYPPGKKGRRENLDNVEWYELKN